MHGRWAKTTSKRSYATSSPETQRQQTRISLGRFQRLSNLEQPGSDRLVNRASSLPLLILTSSSNSHLKHIPLGLETSARTTCVSSSRRLISRTFHYPPQPVQGHARPRVVPTRFPWSIARASRARSWRPATLNLLSDVAQALDNPRNPRPIASNPPKSIFRPHVCRLLFCPHCMVTPIGVHRKRTDPYRSPARGRISVKLSTMRRRPTL